MKRKKKRKLKKSVKKLLILIPIIAVIAMVCVYGFALKDVSYSSDLQQYSAEEVKAYLNAKKIDNTLLFWIKNKIGKSESIDLFEEYTVKMQNPMKVKIISYEKKLKGYIKIYNSFYQVDEDGKVLKITAVKPKDIPIITGLDIKKASMYNVLETGNKGDIPALTNMFKELDAYKLKPKKIDINRNCEITMYIKDLKVQLVKNNNLDKKLSDFNDLYKNASKYKGTLNMKWVSTDGSYTLKKEQETTKSKNTKTKNNKK